MTTSKGIIQKSLTELQEKRAECEAELRGIDKAITSLEGILIDMGEQVESKPSRPVLYEQILSAAKPARRTKKITEKEIRDAVVRLGKNPPDTSHWKHSLRKGFFTTAIVAEEAGVGRTNEKIKKYLEKFVSKGMLESAVYKNGSQYGYIDPAITGAEKSTGPKIDKTNPEDVQRGWRESGSIPGTGNNKPHTSDKDVEQFLRAAQRQGYTVTHMGNGHRRVSKKDCDPVTLSGTHTGSAQIVKKELQEIGVKL